MTPLPAPPAVSVGVAPLVALAGDAAAQRAESLTRELTAMLARTGTLIRVVPVSGAQAKVAHDDSGAVARALNVRYLAEGEIQPGQDATTIGLRLVVGATGERTSRRRRR